MDYSRLKEINEQKAQLAAQQVTETKGELANLQLQETIVQVAKSVVEFMQGHVSRSVVVNQIEDFTTREDAAQLVESIDQLHNTLKTHENVDLTELTGVMQGVLNEVKLIPKEHPEEKEEQFVDYTEQLTNLTEAVNAVNKAIEAQETTVKAPDVHVAAPNVTLEAPDLKPLTKEVNEAFTKAIKSIVFPEYKVDLTTVEKNQQLTNKLLKDIRDTPGGSGSSGGGSIAPFLVDGALPVVSGGSVSYELRNDTTTDTNLVYLGKAEPGTATSAASWQIKRYNKSAGHMSFADDATTFTKVWDNRSTYGY